MKVILLYILYAILFSIGLSIITHIFDIGFPNFYSHLIYDVMVMFYGIGIYGFLTIKKE